MKVVILMGSDSDRDFADKIGDKLREYGLSYEQRVASAHRTPKYLLDVIASYREEKVIYITVVGLSDALSGVLAYNALGPVIACPPDISEWKTMSTVKTPKDVPVALVEGPTKAALFAATIASLHDSDIRERIWLEKKEKSESVVSADRGIL